jgi:hypothetical protein
MLKQYQLLDTGVVKQKRIKNSPLINYKDYYDSISNLVDNMSYLRLGYMLGVINRPASVLDVGYGNGSFLKIATTVINKCYGYDLNDYEIPDRVQRVNSIESKYYDIITFFDSLQKFGNLDFMGNLRCSFVMISVPECHYPENTEWFINWKHRKVDEHIHHFSRKALLRFMASHGYSCIGIGNVEDSIRGNLNGDSNILTGIFRKINVEL